MNISKKQFAISIHYVSVISVFFIRTESFPLDKITDEKWGRKERGGRGEENGSKSICLFKIDGICRSENFIE